jgi:hypothetical protein
MNDTYPSRAWIRRATGFGLIEPRQHQRIRTSREMHGLLDRSSELKRRHPQANAGPKEVRPLEFGKRLGRFNIATRIPHKCRQASIRIVY